MAKRLFDVACALFGLGFFGPVLVLIAIAIVLEDGQSVFFRQDRVGRGRRTVRVFKFRTMRDGVVTRVGRWLRATGIDEIPQFINVLTGDMSMVGPRPLTEVDIERLGWNDDRHAARWHVRPGITGLAQLYGGQGAEHSWFMDRHYMRIGTVPLDAWLVFLSFVVNIVGKKRVRAWLLRRTPRTA